ncbi:hypothetical protein HS041_28825 [Planomonospora sp. ID67723]|uniref:hypothetical protein n=1 Tax=Planomonospora sp. ID67723 TaxID=2738134 RepID=UPI0018C3AEB4|nr:hypothetical protein [Planomonospora sp. ID67723]MBG0831730.1 hypothetical protein [Planomonospora sp. ID67723]
MTMHIFLPRSQRSTSLARVRDQGCVCGRLRVLPNWQALNDELALPRELRLADPARMLTSMADGGEPTW